MRRLYYSLMSLLTLVSLMSCGSDKLILKTDRYSWYEDRIEQGTFTAIANSDTSIISNYQSPTTDAPDRLLEFKLSINGKDNEMIPGINHKVLCSSADTQTPLMTFGQLLDMSGTKIDREPMDTNTRLTIRVDMSPVIHSFDSVGYYTTPTGYTVYKDDFKGLWIAGGIKPLQWDFDNLMGRTDLQLKDDDGDNVYEVTILLNEPIIRRDNQWTLTNDISSYPSLQSPNVLENAMYNMAVDEMVNAIEDDNTLRTGAEWAGVWTRDVSYSIILSMSYMLPEVSKNSLLRKVNSRMRIIQDTGTGGAWPCSTDRMIWSIAAWDLYLVTGDLEWLEFVYPIICNSIEDDRKVAYNSEYGLMMGESSFIDWRDQSYPKWMQSADIYQSMCVGTNAVHYQSLKVAARMATILDDHATAERYNQWADSLRDNINKHFYREKDNYYAMYLYGRNSFMQEPRSESLGEALCILWDIVPEAKTQTMTKHMPFSPFGAPIFFPYIEEMPAYHNNAVWPFVSSYYGIAYAKAHNTTGVLHTFASIYRAAAMFCTNKENFEATTGDFKLTQVNSSNMLWSLSGNIGMTHKVLFGINYQEDGLHFNPVIPSQMKGNRRLSNFPYRDAILDIEVNGYGSEIASFTIDDQPSANMVPTDLTGRHTIKIEMRPSNSDISKINLVDNQSAPRSVQNIAIDGDRLSWSSESDIAEYIIYFNGQEIACVNNKKNNKVQSFTIDSTLSGEYQIRACHKRRGLSFASEPYRHYAHEYLYEVEKSTTSGSFASSGYNGKGYIVLTNDHKQSAVVEITVPDGGRYAIDVRYANGNGPTNTENKCAIRSLNVDNNYIGSIVMPQRGVNEWSNWGWSNPVTVDLTPGKHTVSITYESFNFNMNIKNNTALIDQLRLTKLN